MSCAHRNRDREPAATPELALGGQLSAVQFDEFVHERQPDSGSFVTAALGPFDAVKSFEHARQFVLRNSGAGVLDNEHCAIAVSGDRDDDAAVKRELEGV